ncbi:MAG: 50S ribosomal protein L29 [Fidelibacterota bacterium]
MKSEELKELTLEEARTRLQDSVEELENLKFQQAMHQLENPMRIRYVRREIAQLRTIIREFELGIRTKKAEKKS